MSPEMLQEKALIIARESSHYYKITSWYVSLLVICSSHWDAIRDCRVLRAWPAVMADPPSTFHGSSSTVK